MKKIFIITINFNSAKETHACLASLEKLVLSKEYSSDIVVVDNGSDIPLVLKEATNIHLLRSDKNLGFSGGNNLGIHYALENGADYLMLINNDTRVDKNLVAEFFSFAEKNENVGIIGPKIYFEKGHEYHKERYKKNELGNVLWYAGGAVDWANVFTFHKGVDEVDSGQYDVSEETGFISGCCMFIPVNVVRSVGEFDDKYFLYYEDADLNERVKKAGYRLIYYSKAYLWHVTAASSGGSGSALHDYYLTRNRLIFGMKYAPLRSKVALLRESLKLLFSGREWQKRGVKDFYVRNFGRGSFT